MGSDIITFIGYLKNVVMKAFKIHLRTLTFFLSALILLQGCTVYKSTSVSLDEALKAEIQTRVKTNYNQTLKFKRIGFEDGQYYGVKKINGEMIKTHIDEQKVEKVQLKDESLSVFITVVFPLALIGLLALILYGDMIGGYSDGFH
jgi:hypothetical protein